MISIVGRPNVGKSTLFNRLAGRRKAIVHDMPGITRDRVMADVELAGRLVTLVDTGGFDTSAEDVIRKGIREQVDRSIRESAVILLVVDCRTELSAQDLEIVDRLRRAKKPVVVVGNKADVPDPNDRQRRVAHLHGLGLGTVVPVSAEHSVGVDELDDEIARLLPAAPEGEAAAAPLEAIRVAIVGRPNVGKSSLANAILGDERCLVTEVAGTTRDAVDVLYETQDGARILFIDTAGIRRKGKVEGAPEKLSVVMARKAIERCDVAVMVLDGSEAPSHQDAVVAGYAYESGRAVVLVLNKWDLLRGDSVNQKAVVEDLRDRMKFLDFAPIVKVSAKTGFGTRNVVRAIRRVHTAASTTIPTSGLNRFAEEVVRPAAPSMGRSELKVYYITQSGVRPPTFKLFTNAQGRQVHFSFVRFVENQLRKAFGLEGTPLRLKFVSKNPRRRTRATRGADRAVLP